MQDVLFSPVPVSDLVNAISADVLTKLLPILNPSSAVATTEKEEPYITRKEAAKILRVSLVTLHGYTVSGMVPAYRVQGSRQVRFKETEVRRSFQKIKTVQSDTHD